MAVKKLLVQMVPPDFHLVIPKTTLIPEVRTKLGFDYEIKFDSQNGDKHEKMDDEAQRAIMEKIQKQYKGASSDELLARKIAVIGTKIQSLGMKFQSGLYPDGGRICVGQLFGSFCLPEDKRLEYCEKQCPYKAYLTSKKINLGTVPCPLAHAEGETPPEKPPVDCRTGAPWLSSDWNDVLFAVVDVNYAHHMSLPLAAHAFAKHGKKSKRLVLNFDSHNDTTTAITNIIVCSTWGAHILGDVPKNMGGDKYRGADFYVVTGIRMPGLGDINRDGVLMTYLLKKGASLKLTLFSEGADKNVDLKGGYSTAEKMLNAIEGKLGTTWSECDVYLTVDRDVAKGSFTKYKDGFHSPVWIREQVAAAIGYLKTKGANLVGFDVTGLPDKDGQSAWNEQEYKPEKRRPEALSQTLEDIDSFWKAFSAAVG